MMMTRICAMFVMLKEGHETHKNYTPAETTVIRYLTVFTSFAQTALYLSVMYKIMELLSPPADGSTTTLCSVTADFPGCLRFYAT